MIRTVLVPAVMAVCACSFSRPEQLGGDGGIEVDARTDGPQCAPGFVNLCGQQAPTEILIASNMTLDTDNDVRCRTVTQSGGPDICLLYFTEVEIEAGGTLFAHGSRPLALVATGEIRILGTVDVSSKRSRIAMPGAGSHPVSTSAMCSTTREPAGVVGPNGGGGGAGGTFGTRGGNGATGDNDGQNLVGGLPGIALSELATLRGGCNGQEGGLGRDAPGGLRGLGGGAVYLSAASLQIHGAVVAGGSGGGPAGLDDGGGGGGSGGAIVLESTSLTVSGLLLATGGGAGQGADGGDIGFDGQDATTITAAMGGRNPQSTGFGGNGGTAGDGTAGATSVGGAGGGGGGTGFIILLGTATTTAGSMMMPPPKLSLPR